jgi:hypothetical protein
MNRSSRFLFVVVAIILSALSINSRYAFAVHTQTFTGEVGDAMCGRKHMEQPAAECTRACISHGSRYILITKDSSIYILATTDKTALAMLDKHAGKNTTITGTLNGDTIEVRSVAAK